MIDNVNGVFLGAIFRDFAKTLLGWKHTGFSIESDTTFLTGKA